MTKDELLDALESDRGQSTCARLSVTCCEWRLARTTPGTRRCLVQRGSGEDQGDQGRVN